MEESCAGDEAPSVQTGGRPLYGRAAVVFFAKLFYGTGPKGGFSCTIRVQRSKDKSSNRTDLNRREERDLNGRSFEQGRVAVCAGA